MNPTPRIVHIQTKIETAFGIVDDHGNVATKPIALNVSIFDEQTFRAAYHKLAELRQDLERQAEASRQGVLPQTPQNGQPAAEGMQAGDRYHALR